MASEICWLSSSAPQLATRPRFISRPAAASRRRSPAAHLAAGLPYVRTRLNHRRVLLIRPRATDQQGKVQEDEIVDSKILPYCSLDKKAEKKTIGELEQEFLQALQSFYYDNKAIMTNEEFDNLKEELMWEGSSVVMLSPDEQKFLEASLAYVSGKPVMTDAEFDALKLRLKIDGSSIVQEGPRCSLRSKKALNVKSGLGAAMFVCQMSLLRRTCSIIRFITLTTLAGMFNKTFCYFGEHVLQAFMTHFCVQMQTTEP